MDFALLSPSIYVFADALSKAETISSTSGPVILNLPSTEGFIFHPFSLLFMSNNFAER